MSASIRNVEPVRAGLVRPLIVFGVWMLATWFLEKRTGLLLRHAPFERAVYALVANVGVGIVGGWWIIAHERSLDLELIGLSSPRTRVVAWAFVIASVALGSSVRGRDWTFVMRASSQVLPTTLAEITLCFALIGGVARTTAPGSRGVWSAIVGAAAAFSVYHVAHSAPFDSPSTMLFLLLPGAVTAALMFVGRSLLAAVVVHQAFAIMGMAKNANPTTFAAPFAVVHAVAAVAVLAFAAAWVVARRTNCARDADRAP